MIGVEVFHRTILEQPEADAPRLVFADWLEERGDPHADLIRCQVELSRLSDQAPQAPELIVRVKELLTRHQEDWLRPVRAAGFQARFRRGFLEVAISGVRDFLDRAERLFAHSWVLHAHLRDSIADLEDVAELAASPHLARVQKLDLSRCRIRNEGVAKLAHSPFHGRLIELGLRHVDLSTDGIRELAEHMDLSRLRVLELKGNGIGAVGARALATCPRLAALERLDLSYNSLRNLGGQYLAESLSLGRLKELIVRGNRIGVRGRKALRHRFGPRVFLGSNDSTF